VGRANREKERRRKGRDFKKEEKRTKDTKQGLHRKEGKESRCRTFWNGMAGDSKVNKGRKRKKRVLKKIGGGGGGGIQTAAKTRYRMDFEE